MAVRVEQVAAALPAYEIEEELGRGSTGVVLAARHRQLGREVAVKLLTPGYAEDPELRSRFLSEARMLASFSHTHIVPVYDFVEHDGSYLLVLERLSGGTLGDQRRGLDPQSAVAAAVAMCSALHYAHERDVLHRDVKPGNALITRDGLLKMTDFGVAKMLGGTRTYATRTGFVLGTPAYMAPEQAGGSDPGPPTDVYAAGTVLYELLAGRLPYEHEGDALQMLYRHVHVDPQPLSDHAPHVPEALAGEVMRSLEREPSDRHQSAEELGVALATAASNTWGREWAGGERFLAAPGAILSAAHGSGGTTAPPGETVGHTAPPSGGPPQNGGPGDEEPERPGGRRRLALVAGGLVALLVAIAAVALLAGGGDDEGGGGAAAPTAVRASDWRELPPAREPRQQAPATVQFGTIWLLGGLVGKNATKPTRSVEGFDTAIDQWKGGTPLPVPLHHPMAATYRGRLVVMGGWIPEGDVISAKSSNRVWELRGERWAPLPPMKSPRVAGGAAVVGGKLVVAGGQNQGKLVATTEVFDGKSWKTVADMPTPREHLGAATDGRYLYTVGGRELAADKNLAALERYDPGKDEWTKLPGMPKPLGGLGAAFAAGRVVAVGSETPNAVLGTTLLYDVARERWSSADSLPHARHGLSVAAVGRTVYALGGGLRPGHTNSTNEADALTLEER